MKTKLLTSISLAFLSLSSIAQPGSLDMTFTPGGGPSARVYDSKIHTSEKPLLAGSFNEYDSWFTNQVGLTLPNTNGTWNSSFNVTSPGGLTLDIYCSAIETDGSILAGGSNYDFGSGVQKSTLRRFNELGALDNTFNPAELLNGFVDAIAVQSDGKVIYAARYTDAMNTTIPLYKLERLNAVNGSIDATFNVGTGPNDAVRALAIQSDGKIIIGGSFTSYNGTTKNHIARINANGSIDNTFNVGTGFSSFSQIKNIQLQSDGKIIVVGEFTSYNGTSRSGIVRINTNGSIDTSFNPGTGANGVSSTGVYDLAIQSDGKIIIVGSFFSYNGINISKVARINSNGTLDTSFDPGTGPNQTIHTVSIQSDGKIIIAGDFTSYNGTTRNRVARLLNCTPPTITGTTPNSRCDAGTVSLGATASAGTLSWYAASTGGSSLGTGASFVTPSISSTTTYYVEASNGGCTSPRTAVVATVNTTPTITGTTPNNRCDAGTVTLGATASAGTLSWYAASTGGSALGTGTSFITPSISTTTTYYVEASNGGCTSSRTAVIATINEIPTITGTTPNNRCGTGTVTLGATASAGTLSWYAASTGGSALGTGTSFVTPSISTTTTYYVEASNGGCTSSRTAVIATINEIPTITGTTPNNRCGTGTVTLGATASAGTLSWYAASTGGSVLGTGTSFVTPSISSTTTYYVESSNGGCTSPRTAVTATVNTTPTITGTTPNSRCDAGTVTLGATANAGTLSWYAASIGGSVLGTGTSFVTPSISSTTTYYVESSNGGCTSPRTAVTATVNTTPTITGTTPNNRCDVGTVILGATASAGTLSWYAASTGGSVLGTGTSFVTPSISSTTTYYVESSNGGCTSPRTAVTATVNTTPTITGTTPNNRCDVGTVTLGATASAGTLSWYAASTGGSVLGTGTSFVTPSISSTTTYYVEASNGGCTSPRTAVIATVNNSPTATVNQTGNTLTAQENGMSYQWVNCNTGNSPISGENGQSFNVTVNGNYAVEVTQNGCTTTSNCVNVTITGIESLNTKSLLSTYPNPNKGVFNIESNEVIKTIQIYDALGKVVFNQNQHHDNKIQVNLVDLNRGVYFIKVTTSNAITTNKIIIE